MIVTPSPESSALTAGTDDLDGFVEATGDLLNARLLLQRVDRKYVIPSSVVPTLLTRLRSDYHLLSSAGARAATYETHYFDTADRAMYDDHRRGRLPRYKVRVRHHLERQVSFLEVKRKQHAGRTSKVRMRRSFGDSALDGDARRFVDEGCGVPAALLGPRLSMTFRRVTLLNKHHEERLTLDSDLAFLSDGRVGCWPRVVIVELKQARYTNDTAAVHGLRALQARETSISKYCLATATLATVRANTFKPALRELERLSA